MAAIVVVCLLALRVRFNSVTPPFWPNQKLVRVLHCALPRAQLAALIAMMWTRSRRRRPRRPRRRRPHHTCRVPFPVMMSAPMMMMMVMMRVVMMMVMVAPVALPVARNILNGTQANER